MRSRQIAAPFAVWPILTWLVLVLPVTAGLAGTLAPAFGWLPAIGLTQPGLQAFTDLLALPGLLPSIALSVGSALAATLIAWTLACAFVAATTTVPAARPLRRWLIPMLAAPPVAVAIGVAFFVAPSGWLLRLSSPWLTGFDQPPLWLFPGDPWGVALVLGLVVKEAPFLVLMLLAAQAGRPVERELLAARSLGHGPVYAWVLIVLPQLYPALRLPIFAVLAYGLSPVDMALVLGPTVPPVLAVRVVELLGHADLSRWSTGAAAALLLLGLAIVAALLWRFGERAAWRLLRAWLGRGPSARPRAWEPWPALLVPAALGAMGLAALATMGVWSVAGRWRFPAIWPERLVVESWAAAPRDLAASLGTTAGVALIVTAIAMVLALLCLEAETHRTRSVPARAQLWLFLPLLIPQAAFLFGLQVLLVALKLDGTLVAVGLLHLCFVLPYAFLALAGPMRTLDPRWSLTARSLGQRPWVVLWRVKLPLLLAPVATAAAIGVAVSVALYLPTLFAGGGRVRTLALDAAALAGSDRRSAAVVVVLLILIPLVGFAVATLVRARVERRT